MTETANPSPPEPAPEEPQTVEIHKVKPIHTWRDFAKELSTIVLGIIIAISLEHFVEEWSWEKEVTAARQAIHAEMAANNENLFAFRLAIASCVDRELAEADRILAALEAGHDPGASASLRVPAGTLVRDAELQSERASQVLTHFPRPELALISRYYAQLPDFRNFVGQESAAWQRLSVLPKLPKGATASDLIGLRADLRAAQDAEYLIIINGERQLRVSQQLGVATPAANPVRVKNWCTMSTDAYRRYRRSQDLR